MTKKPLNPLEDEPTASSSEAETSSGEEEEEGSSSEEDEPQPPSVAAVPSKPAVSATATKEASDSDSGETETDSDDSDSEPPKNPSKAIAVTNPKKKESLSSSSATLDLPAVKSGTKRPSEGTSKATLGEDTKKPIRLSNFQRFWSEADEISLLQGLIDFQKETGKSPYDDTNQLYESVKKSICIEFTKTQFMDKLRRLRDKYMGKGKYMGRQVSSKPHDLECLALSKSIWGPEGMALESAKSNGKIKKLESVKQDLFFSVPNGVDTKVLVHGGGELETSDWFENSFLVPSIAGNGVDERRVKQGWRSAPAEAKKKIEEEMKALGAMEMEFVICKTQFLNDGFSMIAQVMKQRGDI